jgi:hypothetical protein
MMLGRTCHTTAFFVAPAGICERTTNHPFWARLRASNNCNGAPSDVMLTRVSGSSGESVTEWPPLANGSGSPDPSVAIGPVGSRGKIPDFKSIK